LSNVFLLTPAKGKDLAFLCEKLKHCSSVIVGDQLSALDEFERDSNTTLIGYGTGIIVPSEILKKFTRAYNFHAASPAYPGRDPHHFAIYHGATEYGATAHVMNEGVDEGDIIGIERFRIPSRCTPARLLILANEAMRTLFVKLAAEMTRGNAQLKPTGEKWGTQKTTRGQFKRMCTLSPLMSASEFSRRFRAFDGDAYDNLTVPLHGHVFRIDKSAKTKPLADTKYHEFTERNYRAILRQATAAGYEFVEYGLDSNNKHLLWRHDLDFSVHRGLRLAQIEAEENVRSTWFVNLHSSFYNINERSIKKRLHGIVAMGHWIGLHFDPDFYDNSTWNEDAMASMLQAERNLVQSVCGVSVNAVSWHNPDANGLLSITQDRVAGMINCYSTDIQSRYEYVSDSNGYWRFKSIPEVLDEGHDRIQILTHPGWWTPEPMAPRDRVERCLLGRARSVAETYDADLARHGRRNLGAEDSI
jgi:hypothetical protein